MSVPPPRNLPPSLNEVGFFSQLIESVYQIWVRQQGVRNAGKFINLAIDSGAVTIISSRHKLTGEGGIADDLDTINGGVEGDELILRAADSSVTITVKDGAGNIALNGDFDLDHAHDTLSLIFEGNAWIETGRSSNA